MGKDIKLVAIDIDGTLVDNNLVVSKNTIDIIKNLKDRDIEVSLVTGRAYAGAKMILDQMEISLPVICHNGGKVVLEDGKIIGNKKFPISSVREVVEYGKKNELYMKAFIDDTFYVTTDNELSKGFSRNYSTNYKVVDNFIENIVDDINLLILFYDRNVKDLNRFQDLEVEVTTSMPYVIELIPKGVSKAWGLKELKRHLSIKREEILAIGNGFNDLSMLEFAGTGIAMKNSDPLLLNRFSTISKFTNNEEGVYEILKDLLYK